MKITRVLTIKNDTKIEENRRILLEFLKNTIK